jgi:hypothetical protein
MFTSLFNSLFAIEAPLAVCVLPKPVAPKDKAAPAPKEPGVFEINRETRTFGFRHDKEATREGAVANLTAHDCAALEERGLWGGKKVVKQNATAKAAWHDGKTVGQCAAAVGLSDSWAEKRYGAFSAALSEEREG